MVTRALVVSLFGVLSGLTGCSVESSSEPQSSATPLATTGAVRSWSFEDDAPGAAPAGFSFARTGPGRDGVWRVQAAGDAPDGRHVLVQSDTDDTDDRYAIAVANEPQLADLKLSVRGQPQSGEVDQTTGLVFRYVDHDNYYLTRANAIEGNVRLYHVTGGVRKQIASWVGDVPSGQWHTLAVQAQGDHLQVSFNGAALLDVHDSTLTAPGRVGLWTKADSVSAFDELHVEPLAD